MSNELSNLTYAILNCNLCGEYTEKVIKKTGEVRRTAKVKIRKGAIGLTESAEGAVPGKSMSKDERVRYLWIGEAPGVLEDKEGEPFIGKSGRYLKGRLITQLAKIPLKYCRFTNIVKCHPEGNRDPYKAEIEACWPWLEREIDLVKPDVIFTVGRIATKTLLETDLKSGHGQLHEWRGRLVMPMYHPAGVDRATPRRVLENDYKGIKEKIEKSSIVKSGGRRGLVRPDTTNYHLVEDQKGLGKLNTRLDKVDSFSLDIETDEPEWARKEKGVDEIGNKCIGVAIGVGGGEAYYIPTYTREERLQALYMLMPHVQRCEVFMHNAKFEMKSLDKYGFEFFKVFCTMLAAKELGEETLGLKDVVKRVFGVSMHELSEFIDLKKEVVSNIPLEKLYPYACADADYTYKYGMKAKGEIEENKSEKSLQIKLDLLPWIAQQELEGLEYDEDKRLELEPYFSGELSKLKNDIDDIAGVEINLNSPQQLQDLLYEWFELEPIKKTKGGGQWSTDKEALRPLTSIHPIIKPLLLYSSLSTIKSTFIDGLPKRAHRDTGRIHASINQAVSSTSRLTYSAPNWQNLPVRRPETRRIREVVVPDDLMSWIVAIDQSQIELRIAAHLSGDERMLEILRTEDGSIHKETCRFIYGIEEGHKDWDYSYKNAKNGNFAAFYDATVVGISKQLECSDEKAKEFLSLHRELFPGYWEWTREIKRRVKSLGYTETMFGFRQYLPEINSTNKRKRSEAGRKAVNTPVQGTSAGIIQLAMGRIWRRMEEKEYESRMIIQVHDELVFSMPEWEVMDVVGVVREELEYGVKLSVPTPTEVKVGSSWGEVEDYEKWKVDVLLAV